MTFSRTCYIKPSDVILQPSHDCFLWSVYRSCSDMFAMTRALNFILTLSMCILKNTFKHQNRRSMYFFYDLPVDHLQIFFKGSHYPRNTFLHLPFCFPCALPTAAGTCSGKFRHSQAVGSSNYLFKFSKECLRLLPNTLLYYSR